MLLIVKNKEKNNLIIINCLSVDTAKNVIFKN